MVIVSAGAVRGHLTNFLKIATITSGGGLPAKVLGRGFVWVGGEGVWTGLCLG